MSTVTPDHTITTPLFVSTAPSRLTKRAIGQQEQSYNLSYTELHCLRAHERTRARERENRQRRTERRTDRNTDRQRRKHITGTKNSLVLNCETQCLAGRESVRGELIDRRLSSFNLKLVTLDLVRVRSEVG